MRCITVRKIIPPRKTCRKTKYIMKLDQQNNSKFTHIFPSLTTGGVVVLLTIIGVMTFSKTAHASLISFVASIFGGEQVSAEIKRSPYSANSQNVSILQPAVNIDPNPEKVADIVPVNNSNTLVADLASDNTSGYDTSNTQISTYIVRQGDTISEVAKMFKVTVNTILWANDLTGKSTLRAGETLVILPISGISYTIKKGDTVKGIAQKYSADVNDILNYNDITISTAIVAGQTLLIPDAESAALSMSPKNIAPHGILKIAPNEPILDGWNWPAYPGYYMRPIAGGRKSQNLHGHNAVDFAAPVGTKIVSSAAGTVIIAKLNGAWNGGYGNYVVVLHKNGSQTLYAHMSRESVSVGDAVEQGQTLGYIGMTGMTTGPHVHYEIRGAQNPF